MLDIKETVVESLKEVKPSVNLEEIEDIIDGGYLDSLELMNLIMILSSKLDVEIEFDEITPENFNSVGCIVKLMKRLTV